MGITAAMPEGTGLQALAEAAPSQFFDVGIAEQHAVTLAAGLACGGMKPVVAIYSTFLQRAYDQVIHDVCIQNLPVAFAIDRAGLVGDDGPTHHGLHDLAYLRTVPNMIVMAPKDENELRHMLKTAVEWSGPAAVRYPRGNGYGVPLDERLATLEIGRAEILESGEDVALIALGSMVAPAVEAARLLAQDGVDAAVVNARFCKPLDADCILSLAAKTGRVVTVEEHALAGGFGSAVLECLETAGLTNVRVKRLGVPDRIIHHASPAAQLAACGLTAEGIRRAALELINAPASSQAATGSVTGRS